MKISVLGTRGFPKIQGGVEKHCESLYPLFNAKYQITVYRRKPYVNSDKTYPNIKFIDLPSTKIKGFEAVFHSFWLPYQHALEKVMWYIFITLVPHCLPHCSDCLVRKWYLPTTVPIMNIPNGEEWPKNIEIQ